MKGTPNPGLNLHTFIACCIKLSQEYFRGSPDPLDAMVSQCELYLKLEKADPDAALREREREMRRRRRKKGGDDWSKRRNSDGGGRYSGESERYSLVGYLPPLDFTVGSAPPGKKGTTDSALTGTDGGDGELEGNKKAPSVLWPSSLLSEKYQDRHFPSPRTGYKNIYHLLQDVRK